jgi:hypothetical protein
MAKSKQVAPKPKEVRITAEGNDSDALAMAKATVSPSINAAVAVGAYQRNLFGDDIPLADLADVLRMQSKKVIDGDLSSMEAMLVGQAVALQSIFTSLVRRAQVQTQQRHLEAFLGLGLKAQAQSRATIQALAELKFPKQVAFVRQTNVAHGPQQVNATIEAGAAPRTRKIRPAQTELKARPDGSTTMDAAAAAAASGSHPAIPHLGKIDRPDHARRQGEVITQRRQGRRMARAARDGEAVEPGAARAA